VIKPREYGLLQYPESSAAATFDTEMVEIDFLSEAFDPSHMPCDEDHSLRDAATLSNSYRPARVTGRNAPRH
jgi:hypothetical protein